MRWLYFTSKLSTFSKQNIKLILGNEGALGSFEFLQATLKGIIEVSDCFSIKSFPSFKNFPPNFHQSLHFCSHISKLIHIFWIVFKSGVYGGHFIRPQCLAAKNLWYRDRNVDWWLQLLCFFFKSCAISPENWNHPVWTFILVLTWKPSSAENKMVFKTFPVTTCSDLFSMIFWSFFLHQICCRYRVSLELVELWYWNLNR